MNTLLAPWSLVFTFCLKYFGHFSKSFTVFMPDVLLTACRAGIIIPNLREEKLKPKQAEWLAQGPASVRKGWALNGTICRAHRLSLFANCYSLPCYPARAGGGQRLERGPVKGEQECSMLFLESGLDRRILLLEPEAPQLLERPRCQQRLSEQGIPPCMRNGELVPAGWLRLILSGWAGGEGKIIFI